MLRNGFEPWHLLIALAVLVLLFGSRKLPDMARSLGKSMRILKAETRALHEDDGDMAGTTAVPLLTEGQAPDATAGPHSKDAAGVGSS